MTQLLPSGKQHFNDNYGNPLIGGFVFHYHLGTDKLKDTFQDANLAILNQNPIQLNERGEASIYGSGAYRQVLRSAKGELIWDQAIVDPLEGIGKWVRQSLAGSIDSFVTALDSLSVDVWESENLVVSRPSLDPATWDWTPAIYAALAVLKSAGGGVLRFGRPGIYFSDRIVIPRFVIIDGEGTARVELKQLPGSNKDFIVSENFTVLTGSALTVNDPRVPSWFGLRDIRVDGNKSQNSSGRGVAFYGPAQLILGVVRVANCAGDGIYTEYAAAASAVSWTGQEEGRFDNVISMDNLGAGWRSRGPHNSVAHSIICGRNGEWGFVTEEKSGVYSGGFDYIAHLHTYANGRAVSPAADSGCKIGAIARIGALITDGDNPVFTANNLQIGSYQAFNLGGEREGIVVEGNDISIQSINGLVWSGSSGRTG
ncbi:hypothetical protein [Pseudomonas sp. C9-3]|uniref:hypothetical protein n=1 Tax=Pseudomonas sp. C9-3 TaxID=3078264 RepID=UPI0028E8E705|nr:hypothetical protein [Pseudomonas sp. C9-3]